MENFINDFECELTKIMDIWSEQFLDTEYGGFLTCRDRDFSLTGDKKGAWGQARLIYTYAMMAEHDPENKSKWLNLSKVALEFVVNHMMRDDIRINYLVSREGNVEEGPISIFSEAFTLIGLSKYISVSKDYSYLDLLKKLFNFYKEAVFDVDFKDIAPSKYKKGVIYHAVFMIAVNVGNEVYSVLGDEVLPFLSACVDKVLFTFFDEKTNCVLESKMLDGSIVENSDDTLCINIGHVFESMWFVLDAIKILNKKEYTDRFLSIANSAYEIGNIDGLIMFSIDPYKRHKSHETWKYELSFKEDDKISWSYAEAMVFFIYAYSLTNDEKWYDRFLMHKNYVDDHFIDKEYGDWYHALDVNGNVTSGMKGSTVKDAYHIPRAYIKIISILRELK